MRKRLPSVAAATVAVVALLLTSPGVAYAAIAAGSRVQYKGPGGSSYGAQQWDANASAYLRGESYVSGTLTSGWCLDSLFDWERPAGHHDARVWRTCRSNASSAYSQYDAASSNLTGLQKGGTCYGPDQATNSSAANCTNASGATISVVGSIGVAFPNNCGQHHTRMPDNSILFHGGGSPTSCAS